LDHLDLSWDAYNTDLSFWYVPPRGKPKRLKLRESFAEAGFEAGGRVDVMEKKRDTYTDKEKFSLNVEKDGKRVFAIDYTKGQNLAVFWLVQSTLDHLDLSWDAYNTDLSFWYLPPGPNGEPKELKLRESFAEAGFEAGGKVVVTEKEQVSTRAMPFQPSRNKDLSDADTESTKTGRSLS